MNKPNVLFIMTDQQRYDTVGANGNPIIRTPHLDRLAREAANMQSCFVQAPVCVPSRHTWFTGRYPHSHRCRVNYTRLREDEVLMQSRFLEAGYETGFVGKLHYWPPTREFAQQTGFSHGLIHDGGPNDAYSDYCDWLGDVAPGYTHDYRQCVDEGSSRNPYITVLPERYHETTWCGEKTREMLRSFTSLDSPFFLFSSYWKPHAPFEVPDPWASMYDEVDIPVPVRETLQSVSKLPLPVQRLIHRWESPAYEITNDEIIKMYRAYYGAISQIDHQVGLTLSLLDELGLRESTIVVFTSDHGEFLGEHGLLGKNAFYESAIHVPLMIRYPSEIEPGNYSELVESTDFLGTLLELCDLPVPTNFQGHSFSNLIARRKQDSETYRRRSYVFGENIIPEVITGAGLDLPFKQGSGVDGILHPDAKMVRSERWKYVRYVGHGEELFDIANDPAEQINLAMDPMYESTLQELRSVLLDWLIIADEGDQIAPRWLHDVP